jgi:hypothetical protein
VPLHNKYHISMASTGALRRLPLVAGMLAHVRVTAQPPLRAPPAACRAFAAASAATDGQQAQQRVALIQGASRGLGLEYVRQLLQRDGQRCTLMPVAVVVLCARV